MRIDTQNPIGTGGDDDARPLDNPSAGQAEQIRLSGALDHLRNAAATKDVEPICQAYAVLRRVAPSLVGRELLVLADERLGFAAAKLVISAYSHRRCYLCTDGTVACKWCEGAGVDAEAGACTQCDGLGLSVCGFCGGTGWADRTTVPPELARAVARKQLGHVQTDLKQLQHSIAKFGRDEIDRMPPDQRGALAGRLVRLRAQLIELSACDVSNNGHAGHMVELAQRVGILLQALRR